jgi:hypothetical protein
VRTRCTSSCASSSQCQHPARRGQCRVGEAREPLSGEQQRHMAVHMWSCRDARSALL